MDSTTGEPRGRVVLTLRPRDRIRLSSDSGPEIDIRVDRRDGRVRLSVDAPLSVRVERVTRED